MDHNIIVSLNNITFTEAFFEDEVREGFFVSTMMKRYWAAQLKVLSVIAGICDRHGINWFADYGTLMGAVRHGGYIPWDDDLDICMLRSDYDRFFEVAEKELPDEYVVMTLKTQKEFREPIGRIANSHSIDYSPEHLREFYGCPYTVGVDIFPVDGLYNDPDKEKERKTRAAKALEVYGRTGARNDLLKIDSIYSECSDVGASKVALMRYYMTHGNHIYERKMFESYVELPFENTYIRVPAVYDEKLRSDYGVYMNVSKSGGVHDYPVYSGQESILRDHIGRNPFRYTLDNQELLSSVGRYIKRMTVPTPKKTIRSIVFLPCRAKWWNTMEELWKRAIEDPELQVTVVAIPYYDCDYNGEVFEEHYDKELFPDYVHVIDCNEYDISAEHPDIVVMQVPYDGWSSAITTPECFYSGYLAGCTEELVYIPCFDPDDSETDGDKTEAAIRVLVEQPAVVNSDRVVLKSARMKQVYLKKLVELTGEPTRDYWNQKLVMAQELDWGKEAASEHSDGGYVDSEWKALVGDTTDKKVIVYYVSISSLLQGGNRTLDKIRRTLDTFSENADKTIAIMVPEKALVADLERIDKKLWDEYMGLIHEVGQTWNNCIYDPEGVATRYIEKWDAFYGDPGVLPRQCVLNGIPVMLQNIDL